MIGASRPCIPHPDLVAFEYPLPHLTESLKRQRKIKIVAIGSSSTAGVGTIVPFPSRLELALRNRYRGRIIDLLNRGIGGQEAPEELSRLESDVIAELPTLAIWQVGTNAVYRKEDYNFDDVEDAIAVGLDWLAALPMDVVLMDLQYTSKIVERNKEIDASNADSVKNKIGLADDLEARIAAVAGKAKVNVFRRWALMKHWCLEDGVPLAEMDDGSELHTSEWATQCVAAALGQAIGSAIIGPVTGARPRTV